jgi:hypothetical protein
MQALNIEILNPKVFGILSNLAELQLIRLKTKSIPVEKDIVKTHFASENVLAKDWLNPIENEVWKNL